MDNNTFNASQNLSYNGSTPTATAVATPFYITNMSLAGGITMSDNTMVMNSITPWILWGATSPQDTTHDLTLAQFESELSIVRHSMRIHQNAIGEELISAARSHCGEHIARVLCGPQGLVCDRWK